MAELRGEETTHERLLRLVAQGAVPADAVALGEQVWETTLRRGIPMPDGTTASISGAVMYHLLEDPRIWRHPERVERILRGAFEIRTAALGRRRVLSRWSEEDRELSGYAIVDPGGRVRTMHVVRETELLRQAGQGERIWRK